MSRRMLMLMIGLMTVSTILFAVGIALERANEAGESAGTHEEGEGSQEEGNEAEENEENSETGETSEEVTGEESETELILGINIENPIFVLGAIGVWLALTIGLWLFGRPVLVPIIIVALGTALFDAVEVITQINRSNTGILILAALITILHLAVAALAWRVLRSSGDAQINISSSQG